MKINKVIEMHRNRLGLSQKEYGEKYGVSHAAVSDWERAVSEPSASVLISVLEEMDMLKGSICPLCGGSGVVNLQVIGK